MSALYHTKIVECQPGIVSGKCFGEKCANFVGFRVADDHRVVVDNQVNAQCLQALPLQIVNELVAVQRVLLLVHLHMQTAKPLTGSVVVDHQIVVTQNSLLLLHKGDDVLLQLGAGGLSQQGADGILGQHRAAIENESSHAKAHKTVDFPAENPFQHCGDQYRSCGDHIIAAVGGGGKEGGGVDLFSQSGIKQRQP